jgi:hypothetical protein
MYGQKDEARDMHFNLQAERNFHGAAVIGADGREIPITEEMVSETLFALHDQWRRAQSSGQRANP